jgi:hypothetical protein
MLRVTFIRGGTLSNKSVKLNQLLLFAIFVAFCRVTNCEGIVSDPNVTDPVNIAPSPLAQGVWHGTWVGYDAVPPFTDTREDGILGVATGLIFLLFWLWLGIHAYRQLLKLREQVEEAV